MTQGKRESGLKLGFFFSSLSLGAVILDSAILTTREASGAREIGGFRLTRGGTESDASLFLTTIWVGLLAPYRVEQKKGR